ncbi:hypothetical protein KR074_010651, partial [Drosophila pseudoananassae]
FALPPNQQTMRLERLISIHINLTINPDDISGSQHAYRKGRSTETALHEITKFVEKALSDKEYALIAFLDIEGAFNNILPCSIINALTRQGVGDQSVCFIKQILV